MVPRMNTNQTTFPSFTVTVRGADITFTSAFATLADAYHSLDAHAKKSDFAESLLLAARERNLSPKQAAWIHKLATDGARPRQDSNVAEGLDLGDIIELFARAADAQKRNPKIVLTALDGSPLALTRCGDKSKTPGAVNITDGGPFGENVWFGRINRDGTVSKSRSWKPEVESVLHELALDPTKVASQHGIATGQCCFCSLPLSTKESRSVGYGPICADKFGLPWGHIDPAVEAAGKVEQADARNEAASPEATESPEARAAGRGQVEDIIVQARLAGRTVRSRVEDQESTIQRLQDEDRGDVSRYDPNAGIREWRSRNQHRIRHV